MFSTSAYILFVNMLFPSFMFYALECSHLLNFGHRYKQFTNLQYCIYTIDRVPKSCGHKHFCIIPNLHITLLNVIVFHFKAFSKLGFYRHPQAQKMAHSGILQPVLYMQWLYALCFCIIHPKKCCHNYVCPHIPHNVHVCTNSLYIVLIYHFDTFCVIDIYVGYGYKLADSYLNCHIHVSHTSNACYAPNRVLL